MCPPEVILVHCRWDLAGSMSVSMVFINLCLYSLLLFQVIVIKITQSDLLISKKIYHFCNNFLVKLMSNDQPEKRCNH